MDEPPRQHSPDGSENEALHVTWLGLFLNLGLSALKAIGGTLFNSAALIADAGHSFSDVLSDLVTLWALSIAKQPKDEKHPYGHGKFETVGALFVALMLVVAGIGIAFHAFEQVEVKGIPGNIALGIAIVSILLKEFLYHITIFVAKRKNSRVLIANAWHHRSDAISSVVALIGIGGAQLGYPMMDPIAGILVAGWIIKTGITIGYDSVKELTDQVVEEDLPALDLTLKEIEGVEKYHDVRTRRMGSYSLVDLHVQVNAHLSVSAAHQIGERVRMTILEQNPHINEVLIHIDAEDDLDQSNPALMRPQSEIEEDIREKLSVLTEIKDISHVLCHFLKERLIVQLAIVVDPEMRVADVHTLGKRARLLVEQIDDIHHADIHLELDDV
ncbi:MAG: cation diffusion facilitator family transporter [SAR324 cluster bacterium]|nr:cation diffusion facilitator family transporter [SAR324 cluster bacterium]